MKISLDRNALKYLIESDPEFHLELKAAVLSEICRRMFDKDFASVIKGAEPECFNAALNAYKDDLILTKKVQEVLGKEVFRTNIYGTPNGLNPGLEKQVREEVDRLKNSFVRDASLNVWTEYSAAIKKAIDERLSVENFEQTVQDKVDRVTENEIERRVKIKLDEKLAKMREAI